VLERRLQPAAQLCRRLASACRSVSAAV